MTMDRSITRSFSTVLLSPDSNQPQQQDPMTAADSFWIIPPIQDAIASNLTPHDLAQCCKVSHALASFATPVLWRNITLRTIAQHNILFQSDIVFRTHKRIRNLKVPCADSLLFMECDNGTVAFPNLESLWICSGSVWAEKAVGIVQSLHIHPFLKVFKASGLPHQSDVVLQLCEVVQLHPTLQHLDLEFQECPDVPEMIKLMQSSVRLTKLRIQEQRSRPRPQHDLMQQDTFLDTSIQDLEIGVMYPWLDNIMFAFLAHSPQLQRLVWTRRLEKEEEARNFAKILQTYCPRLQHLELSRNLTLCNDETVFQLLSGLKSIKLPLNFNTGTGVSAILRHCDTLEHVDLFYGRGISLDELISIGRACKKLQTLKTPLNWGPPIVHRNTDIQESADPWNCVGLKELQLVCGGIWISMDDARPLMAVLFGGIGSLAQLQILKVTTTTEGGSFGLAFVDEIDRLSGLVRLMDIYCPNTPNQKLQGEHIEQMLDLWPCVDNLSFGYYPECLARGSAFRGQLRQRRPLLKVNGQPV